MARISTNDHSSAAGDTGLHSSIVNQSGMFTTAQNIVISPMGLSEVPVPGSSFISNAVMTQEGSDLILESPDGVTMVIEGYFSSDTPPNLISSDGKVMTPALVKSFIQASTDFAEDKTAMNDATPVGEAHEVSGNATVTRTDGTTETIVKGTRIFEGDVIETDAKGAVNIHFADESSFAVTGNAKMSIDEFIFDTATNGGENHFSVLRGLFVYTSGLVGREDPDDVRIDTPVGSIGIRGTIITGDIPAAGEARPASISVVEGAIVIDSVTGTQVILSKQFETVHIDTQAKTTENVGVLAQSDMSETFNVLRTVAPTLFSTIEEAAPQDSLPVETAPVEAPQTAPADTAEPPAAEPEPAAPEAPIQLNLMNDLLAPTLEDRARTLTTETPLENIALFSNDAGTLHIGTMPMVAPAFVNPIADTHAPEAPPVVSVEPPPTVIPPPPPPPTNNPPTNIFGSGYTYAVDQQGLVSEYQGALHLNQFFRDAESNSSLTYTVTSVNGLIAGTTYSIDSGLNGLLNITAGPVAAGARVTMEFVVEASDGEFSAPPLTLLYTVYGANINGDGSGNMLVGDSNDDIISGKGGNDQITLNGNNVVAFGGNGADTFILNGDNGKAYGDNNKDKFFIYGGNNNIVSGGLDDDEFSLMLADISNSVIAYGGRGNDLFTIGTMESLSSLLNGTGHSKIYGGEGTDTLIFSNVLGGGNINLSSISDNIYSVEKIKLSGTTSLTLTLDDIVKMGADNNNKLFIVGAGPSNDLTVEAGSYSALTFMGSTVHGDETYNLYQGGGISLYVQNVGDVSGAGIAA